jgi:hypothetical protein
VAQHHHDHDSVIIRASNEHNSVVIGIQLITVDADLSSLWTSLNLRRPMDHCYQPSCRLCRCDGGFRFIALFDATVESMEVTMGRGILLWLLGVPIPIIILLALIWH